VSGICSEGSHELSAAVLISVYLGVEGANAKDNTPVSNPVTHNQIHRFSLFSMHCLNFTSVESRETSESAIHDDLTLDSKLPLTATSRLQY